MLDDKIIQSDSANTDTFASGAKRTEATIKSGRISITIVMHQFLERTLIISKLSCKIIFGVFEANLVVGKIGIKNTVFGEGGVERNHVFRQDALVVRTEVGTSARIDFLKSFKSLVDVGTVFGNDTRLRFGDGVNRLW